MTTELFADNFTTTLAQACGTGDTTITVASAGPSSLAGPGEFRVLVDGDKTSAELMLVTAGGSGTSWTVTRGSGTGESPTPVPAAHASGASVAVVLTQAGVQNALVNAETVAEAAGSSALSSETTRAQTAEGTNASAISTETSRAQGAEAVKAQGLIPTAVKSSSYTAAPADFVPCDVSSSGFTVTLPTAPADKSRIEVKIVKQALSAPNALTINAGGSDVFNVAGGSTALTLKLLFQSVTLQYAAAAGVWYVQAAEIPPTVVSPLTTAAIDRIAAADRQTSQASHRVSYEDATVFTEPWIANPASPWVQKNTNDVIVSTTGQLINGSGGGHAALRPFVPGSSRFRIVTTINVPKSGGGTGIMVGVTTNASDPTVLSAYSAIGINPTSGSASAFAYYGGASHAVTTDAGQNSPSGTGAGIYVVTIVGNEQGVSFTVCNVARTWEQTFWLSRATVGTIAAVAVYNDSTVTTGYIGPIGAKMATATISPRTSIEGVGSTVDVGQLPSGDSYRVELPAGYDSRMPAPVVLWSHGFGWTGAEPIGNAGPSGVAGALLTAGFIVAGSNNGGNTWGNATAQARLLELYRYVRDHYAIGAVILGGQSMGGLAVANAVIARTIPAAGVMLFEANLNLAWNLNTPAIWNDGTYGPSFRAAYGIASDGSNYAVVTAGFDPMLVDQSAFRGIPWLLASSATDGLVDKTQHSDLMAAKLTGNVRELDVITTTGAHNATSQFPTVEPVAFAQRCVAA